jgi:hypothetical protein
MARVAPRQPTKKDMDKNLAFDDLKKKSEDEKPAAETLTVEEDVKPIIKPPKHIEPGTVIELEDCISE